MLDIYRSCRHDGPYRNDQPSIQRRRLKNTALAYLVALEERETIQMGRDQFRATINMTDQQSALVCLSHLNVPERDDALHAFYKQWRDDPLVLDKWFSIQAASSLERTVEDVIALSRHPDFHLSNPNRVRSLVGVFGSQNQVQFHREDGAGYSFVADMIIQIDALNAQIAARLVSVFNQWKRFRSPTTRTDEVPNATNSVNRWSVGRRGRDCQSRHGINRVNSSLRVDGGTNRSIRRDHPKNRSAEVNSKRPRCNWRLYASLRQQTVTR